MAICFLCSVVVIESTNYCVARRELIQNALLKLFNDKKCAPFHIHVRRKPKIIYFNSILHWKKMEMCLEWELRHNQHMHTYAQINA